jgi:hypothetical protein
MSYSRFAEGELANSLTPAAVLNPLLWRGAIALRLMQWVEGRAGSVLLQLALVAIRQTLLRPERQGCRFYWSLRGRYIPPTQ